jgi:hypothetical protein
LVDKPGGYSLDLGVSWSASRESQNHDPNRGAPGSGRNCFASQSLGRDTGDATIARDRFGRSDLACPINADTQANV